MDTLFFTEEHEMLQAMVREFAKNEVEPVARELDKTGEFPSELVARMGELGLMGIPVPEEYGGGGFDTVAYAMTVLELARVDASVAITMAAHTSLGTMPIVLSGSEAQKQKY
ncbi:MAG: acyl-CoA dehydrogenase family protein, partial [Candidatus Neomarinimicrobiota bacterium]